MQNSIISWTKVTWNPVAGCSKVSDGCKYCYAMTLSLRYGQTTKPWTIQNEEENVVIKPHKLHEPYKLTEPSKVFVNSMSDLFHRVIPDWYRAAVFCVMLDMPMHTFQVLTKRPELAEDWHENFITAVQSDEFKQFAATVKDKRVKAALAKTYDSPWADHIWMGASVEDARVLHRLDSLRRNKAHVRFVSAEPLIGAWGGDVDLSGIHWIIVGGESGNHMTPDNPRWMQQAWAREIKNQCVDQGVAYFYKQDSGVRTEMRPYLVEPDGSKWAWAQYPGDLKPPTLLAENGEVVFPQHHPDPSNMSAAECISIAAQFEHDVVLDVQVGNDFRYPWVWENDAIGTAYWYEQARKQCQRVAYVKVVDTPSASVYQKGKPFKQGDILKDWQGRIGEVYEDQYSGLAHVTLLDKAGNPTTRKHWQTGEPVPNRADFTVCEKIEYAGYHLNPDFSDYEWGSAPRKVDVIQQPTPPDEPQPSKPTLTLHQLVTVEGSAVIGKITDLDNPRYVGKVQVKRPTPKGTSYMTHWIAIERVKPAPEGAVFTELMHGQVTHVNITPPHPDDPPKLVNEWLAKPTETIHETIQPSPESAPVITTVVNFQHVKQHWNKDTQTWDDPKYVYCGRRNPAYRLPESPFANRSPEKNIASFIQWFPQQPAFQRIEELRGKTLVCWCKPDACHGDVLVKWLFYSGRNNSHRKPEPQIGDVVVPPGAMAISLWEPYGMLINVLAKQWETRSWSTTYRGPLVICTAKKRDRDILDSYTALRPLFRKYDVAVEPCRFGVALCLVDLTDCIPAELVSEDEQRFGDFGFGRYAWKLENVRRFANPIPVRGRQGLWTWVDPRPEPPIHLDTPADISPDTSRVDEGDKTPDKMEDIKPLQLALLW